MVILKVIGIIVAILFVIGIIGTVLYNLKSFILSFILFVVVVLIIGALI